MSWILEAIVGLLMGILIHLVLRNTRGAATFGTLIAGAAGAIAASKLIQYGPAAYGVHWASAVLGGLVLALIWELLFLGNRRANIIGGS